MTVVEIPVKVSEEVQRGADWLDEVRSRGQRRKGTAAT